MAGTSPTRHDPIPGDMVRDPTHTIPRMRQANEICPECQFIYTLILNIVGRIETDDAA